MRRYFFEVFVVLENQKVWSKFIKRGFRPTYSAEVGCLCKIESRIRIIEELYCIVCNIYDGMEW